MPSFRFALSLALVASVAWSSSARAEDAVVLPVFSDAEIPQELRDAAHDAGSAALESSGYTLRELPPELGEELADCDDEDCAARARAATSADVAVQVRLFHDAARPGHARELVITLFTEPRGQHTGRGLGDGELTEWARAALAEARREQVRAGAGPALAVTGTPQGAAVLLNDEVVGELDFRNTVDPGNHTLVVRHPGYHALERSVHIPDRPGHVERIHVELESESGTLTGPNIPMLAAGISAATVGVGALLVLPIGAGMTGCIETASNGLCAVERRFAETPAIAWGVTGGILLAGGAVLVAISFAIGGEVSVQAGPTSLRFTGRF